jgi:C4-dicarboxylate-specific signal transduction histidine kinase
MTSIYWFSQSTLPDTSDIEILIRDTGCGIPIEFMSRIQEPFFTTKMNGNGLGLSICRSIIWNAGGQWDIKSRPGAGTQIRVLLPIICRKPAGDTV